MQLCFAARRHARHIIHVGCLLVACVYLATSALAQPQPALLWSRTFGGNGDDYARAVRQTPDGGYLVAGLTGNYGWEQCDAVMLKLDAEGQLEWRRVYDRVWDSRFFALEVLPDGGFAAVGLLMTNDNNNEAWVLRADPLGEPLWEQTFGGWMNDQGYAITATADGGFAVAGINATRGEGRYEEYLVRLDADGAILWENSWGVPAINVEARSVRECPDGGFIITGGSVSYGEWNAPFNMFVVRTDAAGQTVWAEQYGGPGNDFATDAVCLDDGGFVIAGYATARDNRGRDLCLLRVDAAGHRVWRRTFGGPRDDAAFQVLRALDGGFLVGGYTASFGRNNQDLCLMKVTERGIRQWVRRYGESPVDFPWSNQCFQPTTDGGYILAGTTLFPEPRAGEMLVVKTGADHPGGRSGRLARADLEADMWTESDVLGADAPPEQQETPQGPTTVLTQNYPNPFNPATEIAFDLNTGGEVSLRVYNVTGQLVATLVHGYRASGHHTVRFDGTGLPSGLYVYTLEAGGFRAHHSMLLMK